MSAFSKHVRYSPASQFLLQIEEVKRRLERFNLRAESGSFLASCTVNDGTGSSSASSDRLVTRDFFLKLVVAGAFYPNYFIRHVSDDREQSLRYKQKDMHSRDPLTTVYLRGSFFRCVLADLYKRVCPSVGRSVGYAFVETGISCIFLLGLDKSSL